MNFIKKDWFRMSIVVILLTIVLSAIYYLFFFIPAQQNSKIYTSDIAPQAKCATQAEIALNSFKKDYSGLQYGSFGQENHYNQKMNKCFVLISYSPVYPPNTTFNPNTPFTQPTNYENLVDAYENTDLAHCSIFGNDPVPMFETVHQVCWTIDNGKTFQDYKNFVLPRMEMPDPYK
ncbi:MAG: hypothetical protein ACYC8S_03365 [Minisyncoccota bacterium]